jgi:hypothetical protein
VGIKEIRVVVAAHVESCPYVVRSPAPVVLDATGHGLLALQDVLKCLHHPLALVLLVTFGLRANLQSAHRRDAQRPAVRHDCVRDAALQVHVVW